MGIFTGIFLKSSLAGLALAAAVSLAHADAAQDCDQDKDADLAIRGCSEYIRTVRATPEQLAVAHVQRGLAYAKKNQFKEAFADYDESARLNPKQPRTFWSRALLHRYQKHYGEAQGDFDRAIALVEAAQAGSPSDANKKRLDWLQTSREEMRVKGQMETHWAEYLKQIQADNEHPNWSAPPHDLYLQSQKARD